MRTASPARRAKSPARAPATQKALSRPSTPGRPRTPPRGGKRVGASARTTPAKSLRPLSLDDSDDDGLHETPVPADLSRKIMMHARAQQEEAVEDAMKERRAPEDGMDDADDIDVYEEEEIPGWEDEMDELEVDEADEALLAQLLPSDTTARRTLADVIMEKLAEHQAVAEGGPAPEDVLASPMLPDKVVQVYTSIGEVLRKYRSGKLPKAFKIVPRLNNWEDVLFLTQPQSWSPQACAAATRIFASSLKPKMAQRFYALILLPAVLDDIDENKRLNYHYYMALKKAIYKPTAFFKGIVLPMCEHRCSLRHAMIVCSVLSKVSVPPAHASATLLKITDMPLSGASILFLRTLLMKKYALPYRVLDALAEHFVSFCDREEELPVIWHQCLLVLAQHYKMELTREQKEELKPVLRKHMHAQITPEIRRELYNSVCRGEPFVPEVDMLET